MRVRWPGGELEEFEGALAGGRYVLEQGRGRASASPARSGPIALTPSEQPHVERTQVARAFLPVRVPLPELPFEDAASGEALVVATRRPLLVNLWASWCAPCVAELRELTARAGDLAGARLGVLALSVDPLDEEHDTTAADAEGVLRPVPGAFRGRLCERGAAREARARPAHDLRPARALRGADQPPARRGGTAGRRLPRPRRRGHVARRRSGARWNATRAARALGAARRSLEQPTPGAEPAAARPGVPGDLSRRRGALPRARGRRRR